MSNYRKKEMAAFAAMFKALSNEHRLRIYLRLLDCCPSSETACCAVEASTTCVGDLGAELDLAPSTVSHHIKELRQAGLIQIERRGRFVHCAADPTAVHSLRAALAAPLPESNRKRGGQACRA